MKVLGYNHKRESLMVQMNLKVVIVTYKDIYYFTRLCVASIRYYYPDVEVFLIKDLIGGDFSTTDLQKYLKVKIMDLGINIFGNPSSKIRLLLSKQFADNKYLALDSDIVLVGRLLDTLDLMAKRYDFVVSSEHYAKPGDQTFEKLYYRLEDVVKEYPDFKFPGYDFNGGQIVITPGLIQSREIRKYISFSKFPYWTKYSFNKLAPCFDQPLLNIILVIKHIRKELRLGHRNFMICGGFPEAAKLKLEDVKSGKLAKLIHWAGTKKTDCLYSLHRSDILFFFAEIYYSYLPMGKHRYNFFRIVQRMKYWVHETKTRLYKSSIAHALCI
jgi:lipopolysaccharide biosynthesis glycosyltransferase